MSEETFDDFLAGQGMLETCEDHAIEELCAESIAQNTLPSMRAQDSGARHCEQSEAI